MYQTAALSAIKQFSSILSFLLGDGFLIRNTFGSSQLTPTSKAS